MIDQPTQIEHIALKTKKTNSSGVSKTNFQNSPRTNLSLVPKKVETTTQNIFKK